MPYNIRDDIEALYHAYSDDIYRFILFVCNSNEGANDILQSTYLQALKNISQFRKDCSVKTWLFAIAKNECYKYQNKKMMYIALEDVDAASQNPVENQAIQKEEYDMAVRCINSLDDERRALMILRLVNELSFAEIGQVLQRSETWSRVTFMRTRKKIAEMIGAE